MNLELKVESTAPGKTNEMLAQAKAEIDGVFKGNEIKKVLLIAPPDGDVSMFDREVSKRKRYWNHPQYGLAIVASVLRKENVDVSLLNLNHAILTEARSNKEEFDFNQIVDRELKDTIDSFQPDLIGITCMYSQAHTALRETIEAVRKTAGETPIAIGGVHPTNAFIDTLTREKTVEDYNIADFLFLYEAEYSFRDFIRVVNGKAKTDALTQVAFLNAAPLLAFEDRARPDGDDLNIIPALDLMGLEEMSKEGRVGAFYSLKPEDTTFATCLFGRGCRFHCTFCSVRQFNGVGVRSRTIDIVLDELERMVNDHGVNHVTWLDDDFLFDKQRSMELFEGLIKRNLDLTWDCSNGVVAASCTEELIAAAEAAGCIGMYLGVESGNPDVLRSIEKPGTVRHFNRAAEILKKYEKIHARAFLIIGLPGETVGQIKDTFDLCQEMDLDWCHVNVYNSLPNTPSFAVSDKAQDASLTEYRFNSGAYGHKNNEEKKLPNSFAATCEGVFDAKDLNYVPSPEERDLIWVYMNYYINFVRMKKDMPEIKLAQNEKYILNIVNTVDPNNAIAYWYAGHIAQRLRGEVSAEVRNPLQKLYAEHSIWRERFEFLGLDVETFK